MHVVIIVIVAFVIAFLCYAGYHFTVGFKQSARDRIYAAQAYEIASKLPLDQVAALSEECIAARRGCTRRPLRLY